MAEMKITDYYAIKVVYTDERDENGHWVMEKYISYYDSASALFNKVAYNYAFDDCDDSFAGYEKIMCDGKECEYAGWEPGMKFRFYDVETDEDVYTCCHEEWDH